jgi:hypothetical protein
LEIVKILENSFKVMQQLFVKIEDIQTVAAGHVKHRLNAGDVYVVFA